MKNFEYVAARSVLEAVEALASSKGPARPIAGGTDLIVQLAEGRRVLDRVVGLDQLAEVRRIDVDSDGGVRLGAAVPCAVTYAHVSIRRAFPMLIDSTSMIGSVQIQGRASVGGNLCNAAPSGDCIPSLICLSGKAFIAGPQGTRSVAVEDFCTGPGQTVLMDGEILTHLELPAPTANEGGMYQRFIPRNEMDIAVAGAGSLVRVDPATGHVTHARIALASVAPTPLRVRAAEDALIGRPVSRESIEEAAVRARDAARPISDVRGSADYRRHLVQVLVRRTLLGALTRAGVNTETLGGGLAYGG